MYKLKKKGDIISPAKHLYVIVPPEQQSIGCIPAAELVPLLMKHWSLNLIAVKMNWCPIKCIGYKTPNELFIQQYKNDCRTWS